MMKKIVLYFYFLLGNPVTILKYSLGRKYIFVDGFPHTKNFGDALGTPIVEFLSGKKVLPSKNVSRFLFQLFNFNNYAVVGSILQWAKKGAIIWGAGFISDKNKDILYRPSAVYAVRGPLTRKLYVESNISCPEVYGDPALLLPLMYYPNITKRYKYGVIPHYSDINNPWVSEVKKRKDVLIIDLMVYTNYKKVVDQILACENILSSSLHGVIVADAYRIPNVHIKLSENVVGNDFKFRDYYKSVNRKAHNAISPLSFDISTLEVEKEDIIIDLRKTIEACPFASDKMKASLIEKIEQESKFHHLRGV